MKTQKQSAAPNSVRLHPELAALATRYHKRAGWLIEDIINAAAECGLAMALEPDSYAVADMGSMFIAAADRAARQRFRAVPSSRPSMAEDAFDGVLRDSFTGEAVSNAEFHARMNRYESEKLVPLEVLGVEIDTATLEKDGVLLRPYEDAMCYDGKDTRCGCLYRMPENWCLSDPLPSAAQIQWLSWPGDFEVWQDRGCRSEVINQPQRSPEHVSFRLELPNGRIYTAGVRGILRAMSRFNQENGWPDERDGASIWKPASGGSGIVLDFEAMDERAAKLAADRAGQQEGGEQP